MLAYIIYHPELIDIVRAETELGFDDNGRIDFHYLNDSCPKLGAIWNETVRMTAYSASVRHLTDDTVIGGKTLRKHNRVMIPYRQLHFNEEVFGKDVNQFDPWRFLRDKALQRSPSWRPFGGGITMCPGRFGLSSIPVRRNSLLINLSGKASCIDSGSNAIAKI